MAKYIALWEMNISAMPADPAQRSAAIIKMSEMTKKALEEGKIKDWGIFPGGNGGYGISEGTAVEALTRAMGFVPYIKFETRQVLSIDEAIQAMKAAQG
jgi:hypothetical protein